MLSQSGLTTADVLKVLEEEIAARGGRVSESFDDRDRLFARSILPAIEEVCRGDRLQGGVALRVAEEEIQIYPYVFRQVCSNGAIAAQTIGCGVVVELDRYEPDLVVHELRQQIDACCATEVFAENVQRMRTALETQFNFALNLAPALARVSALGNHQLASMVLDQFLGGRDQSRFGLANAVTAVARDTRDPEVRWNLEVYGGELATVLGATDKPSTKAPARVRTKLHAVQV